MEHGIIHRRSVILVEMFAQDEQRATARAYLSVFKL